MNENICFRIDPYDENNTEDWDYEEDYDDYYWYENTPNEEI